MTKREKILTVTLCILLFYRTLALSAAETAKTVKTRPSVALVLAGGGARGFVHIPFLALIDELGIPVDMIIGTSAGAIVGGLYCAGYTPDEIAKAIVHLDWMDIFQDEDMSPFENALEAHSSAASIAALKLGTNLSLKLGKGFLSGQKAYEKLKSLTVKIPSYIDFDSLPVSYRATATDLLSGELVVFDRGDLAEAMRASMSIPGFFAPFIIDGKNYIDGGVRENLPIKEARDLGYDIVIAVEISVPLISDAGRFESSPLMALSQMVYIQQRANGKEKYKLADLVMFPDLDEFSTVDYLKSEEIYKRGQREAERYRSALIEIKQKIFAHSPLKKDEQHMPAKENEKTSAASARTEHTQNENSSFTFIESPAATEKPCEHKARYTQLSYSKIDTLTVNGAKAADKRYIQQLFDKTPNKNLDEKQFARLTEALYNTGNYTTVTSRTNIRSGKKTLELNLSPKKDENGLLLLGGTFAGTIASDMSSRLNLSTDLQFRGLSGTGSVLSLKISGVNGAALQFMLFQPLGPKTFFKLHAYTAAEPEFFSPGFNFHPIDGTFIRRSGSNFSIGILFNSQHTLVNSAGIHGFDTRQALIQNRLAGYPKYADTSLDFAGDISSSYIYNSLNSFSFPTRGVFASLRGQTVFPIGEEYEIRAFELLQTDLSAAVPLSSYISILCNATAGICPSEQLYRLPSFVPVYGFNTNDRLFFPHVTGKKKHGIHKGALSLSLQIQPWQQLTILGGQMFFAVNGSTGAVEQSFRDFKTSSLEWQTSVSVGIRLKNMFGAKLCLGAGSSAAKISPFISFDFGSFIR